MTSQVTQSPNQVLSKSHLFMIIAGAPPRSPAPHGPSVGSGAAVGSEALLQFCLINKAMTEIEKNICAVI